MKYPFEISDKMSAVQAELYIDRLGNVGYRGLDWNYSYDDKSYSDIDEVFRMLQDLEPVNENGAVELWLCAKRGGIREFAKTHGSFKENLADGTVKDYEDYKKYWKSAYPDELEWYNFVAIEDKKISYRAIFMSHKQVIEVDGRKGREYPHDISAFTGWLVDAVRITVEAIKQGTYNETIEKYLPNKHRVGIITRANLWELYPESKQEYFEDLTQEEVDEFLAVATDGLADGVEPMKEMTANDFYRCCALGYAANHYDIGDLTPKEQYQKFADGRDDGLGEIDDDSPTAFADWLNNREYGGHPWEVCRGGNSTHIDLFVRHGDEGYVLAVAGAALWRSVEAIKFYLALRHEGIPVLIHNAELLIKRLRGEERIGIVPDGVFPRYCHSWFPDEKIEAFMNLSHEQEEGEKEAARAEWLSLTPAKLRTQKEASNEE